MLVRRTATIGPCEPCPCQPATCCCYVFLLVTVGLQSLGIPLPGETALVTAAALAALGRLSIYGVVAAAAAGAILGDNAGYWIGRKGGLALVPSEFSALRLQYGIERAEAANAPLVHDVVFQLVFSIGPHPAHAY